MNKQGKFFCLFILKLNDLMKIVIKTYVYMHSQFVCHKYGHALIKYSDCLYTNLRKKMCKNWKIKLHESK